MEKCFCSYMAKSSSQKARGTEHLDQKVDKEAMDWESGKPEESEF